jgi:ABC-type multidrug transport system fused ATPase/permease subunit
MAFWIGAEFVSAGQLDLSDLVTINLAVALVGMGLGQAISALPSAGKASSAKDRIAEILDREPLIGSKFSKFSSPENTTTDQLGSDSEEDQHLLRAAKEPNKQEQPRRDIVFDNVSFCYPSRRQRALRNVSLRIPEGAVVALVGPSGGGKSTLLHLLQRMYDPTGGRITIGGVDIKVIDLSELRGEMAVVHQEPRLFDVSVVDNLCLGRPGVSAGCVMTAAQTSHVHDVVRRMPQGYHTPVGGKGSQLSGGEKQRIAIARALVGDPAYLLLDEATSALDTESERVVQEALSSVMKNRTCLVVAHRLSTIRNADIIVVVDDGRVVETGSHRELVLNNSAYTRLLRGIKG